MMASIRHFGLTAAVALVFTSGENSTKTAENTVAAATAKAARRSSDC